MLWWYLSHTCPVFFFYYAGDLSEEEEVLQWLITQRTEDRIELITRVMLESCVEDTQYLAVYFCEYIKSHYFILRKTMQYDPQMFYTQISKTATSATKSSRGWKGSMMNATFLEYIWWRFKTYSWPRDIQSRHSQLSSISEMEIHSCLKVIILHDNIARLMM